MEAKDVIIPLIRKIIKTEIKSQVREEIQRLVKLGILSVVPKSKNVIGQTVKAAPIREQTVVQREKQPAISFSKNSIINEILNNTTPFSKAERDGGTTSILDAASAAGNEWDTVQMTSDNVSTEPTEEAAVAEKGVQRVVNALNRDYRELVKRF